MKLLITGAWSATAAQLNALRQKGHDLILMQNEADTLPAKANEVQGIICNGLFLHHSLDAFPQLRYIQLTSAGYDRVPMDEVAQRGIRICNARGVYSVPMAEFALCGVLQLYKQSAFFLENQRQHHWEKHRRVLELAGQTVCVIGCGSVGQACARVFAALGCRLLGLDPFPCNDPAFEQVSKLDCAAEILAQADVVILTLPLTEQTRYFFDAAHFALLKPGAVLVNIARGAVVDTEALIQALGGSLGGAVLDVFEEEPLGADSPLWGMSNVVLTPHNSFVSNRNADRLAEIIMCNLEQE